jgi:hypothetical protein
MRKHGQDKNVPPSGLPAGAQAPSDEERQMVAALEKRITKRIFDAEYKRLRVAVMEMDFERRPDYWTQARRSWARELTNHYCDYDAATDPATVANEIRQCRKVLVQGKRLPPSTPPDVRLVALAKRLGLSFDEHDLTWFGGLAAPDDPKWRVLATTVSLNLLLMQPEFERMGELVIPGRPRGAQNKEIRTDVTKEALRQRRRRQKKS